MSVTTPEQLPVEYAYGRVVARFLRAVGDSTSDIDDNPEAIGASGSVVFTPTVTERIISSAPPEPSPHISHEEITCVLDSKGYLSRSGNRWVKLWAGEWTVKFQVAGFSRTPFPILVTTDHTELLPLDLFSAQPYVPPTGSVVTTMLVPANPVDGYGLIWDAAAGRLVWGQTGGADPAAIERAVTDYLIAHPPSGLQEHIDNPTPHPAYDVDMQDLATLYISRTV